MFQVFGHCSQLPSSAECKYLPIPKVVANQSHRAATSQSQSVCIEHDCFLRLSAVVNGDCDGDCDCDGDRDGGVVLRSWHT